MSLAYAPMENDAVTDAPIKRLAIELPAHERGRGDADILRFDRLQAKLKRGDLTPKQREAALKERDRMERAPEETADKEWRERAIGETEALAAQRGEAIAEDKAGVRRILDRDPLLNLARAGHITADQLEVAQRVRELYDSRASDAGAMEYTGLPGAAHDHERFVANRFSRAKASAMVVRIERAIAINCSAEPACLTMLRVICERGMSANSQGEGRALDRNRQSFARALDVADAVLRRQL